MWPIDQLARDLTAPPPGMERIDFAAPAGAPALFSHQSVTWQVMKNPLALLVGGIAAVILELAEPRVREGVWTHTRFRDDPAGRVRRTGYAALATVFGPADAASALISRVNALHARVRGATPAGAPYRGDDPELLTWVQATAVFGFLEAYRAFVRPLPPEACDAYYAEAAAVAPLWGADVAPASVAELEALFARMRPKLEASPVIFEFIAILRRAPLLPLPLRPLQALAIRAAVEITPPWARELLGLTPAYGLSRAGRAFMRALGKAGERIVIDAPPAQACRRLGLKRDFLYR